MPGAIDAPDFWRWLRSDVSSGASTLALRAAEALEAALPEIDATDARALRASLARLAAGLIAAQPAMAPLVSLGTSLLQAVPGTGSRPEAETLAADALRAFRARLTDAPRRIATLAEPLMPAGARVVTVSDSATLRAVLLHAAGRKRIEVFCLEGRPNLEGRALALALASAGIEVTLGVDAAAARAIERGDLVLAGADAIGDTGVVNKIGTRAAALAARERRIPIYVLADTSKLLPPAWPQPADPDRPAGEVWGDAPAGVAVWNRYFEATPLGLFEGVVTEAGVFAPPELETLRQRITLAEELRAAW